MLEPYEYGILDDELDILVKVQAEVTLTIPVTHTLRQSDLARMVPSRPGKHPYQPGP